MDMPQKGVFENQNLWMPEGKQGTGALEVPWMTRLNVRKQPRDKTCLQFPGELSSPPAPRLDYKAQTGLRQRATGLATLVLHGTGNGHRSETVVVYLKSRSTVNFAHSL